jgi:acyl carrier protein
VEMVMKLEETFDITIPDEDVEKLRTVGDAVAYLERRLKEKAGV